jgi:hypothetical protein
MATFDFPTPPIGVAKWPVRVEIEGVFYRFLYKWNNRNQAWYIDIADDSSIAQVRSRIVQLGYDIFKPFKYRTIPQGTFNIVDTSGENREPTKDDLGTRVKIQYTEVE